MAEKNELNAWIPYSIYVKGFPLSHCGWNGAYYKRYDDITKSYYWELGETEMLCGLITIKRTIIRRMKEEWTMQLKEDGSLLIRGLRDHEVDGKISGPGVRPFGQWQDNVYIDEEYLPPHEYYWFCTILCAAFTLFCGCVIFIIHLFFKIGLVKLNY